jgi:hypothetical protein
MPPLSPGVPEIIKGLLNKKKRNSILPAGPGGPGGPGRP